MHFGWRGLTALTDEHGTTVRPVSGDESRPDPEDRRVLLAAYQQALDLAAGRNWNIAAALLRQVLMEDPGMIDARQQLARVYEASGDAAKAESVRADIRQPVSSQSTGGAARH
jgi:Tfp pilus assembly protein PilF